jgi:hypothetical protein
VSIDTQRNAACYGLQTCRLVEALSHHALRVSALLSTCFFHTAAKTKTRTKTKTKTPTKKKLMA